MTANFLSRWCFKRWLSTVVFPAPKNPVKIVTGTGVFESRLLVGTSLTTDHFSCERAVGPEPSVERGHAVPTRSSSIACATRPIDVCALPSSLVEW